MAKFSDTFLRGLLQPAYQEGLFEAAKGVGMTPMLAIQEQERKKQQAGVQALMGGVPTLEKIAELRGIATSMLTINPERAEALNKAVDNMQKQYDTLQDQAAQVLTGQAGQIAANPSIESIVDHVEGLENLDEWQKVSLIEQATEQRELIVAERENENNRTLSPELETFIKDNRKFLDENPLFQKHIAVLERTKGSFGIGEREGAVKAIRAIVNDEVKRRTAAKFKAGSVEAQATGFINDFVREDSVSEFIYGRDAVEAAREVFEDEDLQADFVKFVGAEYEKNPNIERSVAVKNALDFMGEKYSDRLEQGRLANKEEDEGLVDEREAVIEQLINEKEMTREEAIRFINQRQFEQGMQSSPDAAPVVTPTTTPPVTPVTTTTPTTPVAPAATTYITPAQMRAGAFQTLQNFRESSAERREEERGMLIGGGRFR